MATFSFRQIDNNDNIITNMAKWADFLISAVKYNNDHTHIIGVKQRIDKGDKVSSADEVSRMTVATNLKNNYSYMTIYTSNDDKWKKGEEVRIIKVGASEFITTDPNETKKDNLGKLPEF